MACSNTPRPVPVPIAPRPRSRSFVVVKLISLVSWIARTCRPSQAPASSSPQPSISTSAVTRRFARKRENPTIPPRLPPASRRRHMLSRATIRASSSPPFLTGARLRNRPQAPMMSSSNPLPTMKAPSNQTITLPSTIPLQMCASPRLAARAYPGHVSQGGWTPIPPHQVHSRGFPNWPFFRFIHHGSDPAYPS
jgi:hypothetical protein